MLWTCFLTLPAADTVAGLSMLQRSIVVVHRMAGKASCRTGNAVIKGKILRDCDILRTSMGTVCAAGTGNRRILLNYLRYLPDHFQLLFCDRMEILENSCIILHLFQSIHARKHSGDALLAGSKTHGPGSVGSLRLTGFQKRPPPLPADSPAYRPYRVP